MKRASVVTFAAVAVKLIALTVLLFAIMALSASALGIGAAVETDTAVDTGTASVEAPPQAARARQLDMALVVLAACLLQTTAVTVLVGASRWSGWRLTVTVFAIGFMMSAVLPHLESLVFLPQMSRVLIGRLVLSNALMWALFSPLAVWLLGRRGNGRPNEAAGVGGASYALPRLSRSLAAWAGALVALGTLHVLLYVAFGYYVAWRIPEVASFYGGEDPGTVFLHVGETVRSAPWFYPSQVSAITEKC